MMSRCVLSIFVFAWAFTGETGRLSARIAGSERQVAAASSSKPQTIKMTVPKGASLQIALDKEVRVRKVGEPITGRVMQPVYVFDRLVVPVGTAATGMISAIEPVPVRTRTLAGLNADFTPAHKFSVTFDKLMLPDGRHIDLHATIVPGSGRVVRLVSADQHKKNVVKDAVAQKMNQARAQWNNAMKQVESPGRIRLATRYAVAQLPLHPQYIDAGTLYSAELSQPLDFGSESVSPDTLAGIGTQSPSGSLVHAVLLTALNSATTLKSADVDAQLSQPLIDKEHLILPAGTRLRGSVLQVRPAGRLHRNGQLRIVFREMILPNGAVQTVDTRLQGIQSDSDENAQLDSEGGAKSTSSKGRYLSTGASVGLALIGSGGRDDVGDASPIAGGATGFKLIGLIAGVAFRSHTYGILMSAYGGGRSIYNNFLGMGRDIVFPKDTIMEISLGNRTALPMPAAQSGETR
jgi:hypothetical protein